MGLQEFPVSGVPDDAALLNVSLCGICGTDKHIYKDEVKSHPFGMPTKFPIIPGHEIVGTIAEDRAEGGEEDEPDGRPLSPGDRVVPVVDLRCEECAGCKMHPGWPSCERGETYGWGISSKDPPHLFGGFAGEDVRPPPDEAREGAQTPSLTRSRSSPRCSRSAYTSVARSPTRCSSRGTGAPTSATSWCRGAALWRSPT